MQLIASDSLSMHLDTCQEMSPYTSQFTRGLYGSPGDGVHHIPDPGTKEYVATICSMIARAAAV